MVMLTDLADACRKSGLTVVERPGWRTRGHGQMRSVESITCHHDVTAASLVQGALGYIEANRLSQLTLARDGTVYVVAAGLCYHAGVVHETWMGNSYAVGIEAAHTGNPRDPWPPGQYAAYVRLVGALKAHYGVPLARVLGHKEVARPVGRKTDPTFDMAEFRLDVLNYLTSAHTATVDSEDDVLTDHQVNQLNGIFENAAQARVLAAQARDEGRVTAAQVAALQALVTAAVAGDDLDVDAVVAAAKEGAGRALQERIAAADVSLTVTPDPG